ncbi:YraN family protein [Candidatus Uhrbacteria bacterium]|nr:YraN family protein [Candidatus Uhrbacteria bacterium]
MDSRRSFGNEGETDAAAYLVERGYHILDRQCRTSFGEIDIVASQGNEIVFVEVKTRRSTAFGFPEESVTRGKLRRMRQAAEAIRESRGWSDRPFRLDVISILRKEFDDSVDLRHFEAIDTE